MVRTTEAAPTGWRRWAPLLVLAAVAQSVAVVVGNAPPIYDGIGFPDEPYRFVDPPADYRNTQPPTTAHTTVAVSRGRSTHGVTVNSAEQAPQISIYVPDGALRADPSATAVTIDAAPVKLSGTRPPGHPWSNVYHLAFTAPGGDARLAPGTHGDIQMRNPTYQSDPACYVRVGDSWQRLKTVQVGRD